MALVGLALVTPGCGEAESSSSLSTEDWVTFENYWVSLQLPDSFKGGDPYDSEVLTMLEEMAADNPDPAVAAVVLESVEDWREQAIRDPWVRGQVLLLWGEPNADGEMPMVEVLPPFDPDPKFLSWEDDRYSMTLEEYVAELEGTSSMTLEALGVDRAFFVGQDRSFWDDYSDVLEGDDDEPISLFPQYLVVLKAKLGIGEVAYTFDDASNTALAAIFRASAESIVIKWQ